MSENNGHINGEYELPTISSPKSESAFISCFLLDPKGTVETIQRHDVRPNFFDDFANKQWFSVLNAFSSEAKVFTSENIIPRMPNRKQATEQYEGFLASDPFPLKAEDLVSELRQFRDRRLMMFASRQLSMMAESNTQPIEDVISDFTRTLEAVLPKPKVHLPEMVDGAAFVKQSIPQPPQVIDGPPLTTRLKAGNRRGIKIIQDVATSRFGP